MCTSTRRIGSILIVLCWLGSVQRTYAQQHCGVERWSVKTGTDADAQQVDLANPKNTTVAELITLNPPNPIPKDSRFGPTETTVWVVNATLTDYKLEGGSRGDSDYHLVLQDEQGKTMVAEIPSPNCVGNGSPFAAQIAKARGEFDAQFTAGSSFQTANVPVQVTGVGFFDFAHGQHGAAPNVIELHPILDIAFNPQSGTNDFSLLLPSTTISVAQGASSSLPLTAQSSAGAPTSVTYSTAGLPTGVTSLVTPTGTGKATLSLSASSAAATGTFPFTVIGTANGKSHSQVLSLNVAGSSVGPGQEWEYQVISASSEQDVIDQANKLGADDWEMVSAVKVTGTPGWRAFFKRVKHN